MSWHVQHSQQCQPNDKCLARFSKGSQSHQPCSRLVPKNEIGGGAKIHSGTSSMLQRNTINGSTVGVVQEKADIEEAKQPSSCRSISTVKDGLDSLKMLFSWILVLLMGVSLPASNKRVQRMSRTFWLIST